MARKTNGTVDNTFPDPKAEAPKAEAAEAPKAEAAEAPKAEAAEPKPATEHVSAGEAKRLSAIKQDAATYIGAGTYYAADPDNGDTYPKLGRGEAFPANPKRGKSRDRFALYRQGMTVADYVAAGGKREDIPWDLKRGFIGVVGVRADYYRDLAARGR